MSLEPETLVMTTHAVVQLDQPRTGRVLGDVGEHDPDRVWLDLNVLGAHLPQMYRRDELAVATPELAEVHHLCPKCLGYGALDGPTWATPCDECRGSGSTLWFLEVNESGNVIEGRLIPRSDGD